MSFLISFRTRSSDATLIQLGDFNSLELKHGSVVYRRSYTTMYTPLTLEALGAVSDGVWHKVRLDVNSTHTKVCVRSKGTMGLFDCIVMMSLCHVYSSQWMKVEV